jgi:predicted nucleic acid-binding protein
MGRNLVIYPDTCFYGRPFDTPQTPKIRAEADAIDAIFKGGERGELWIIGSAAVTTEIGNIADPTLRAAIEALYYKAINKEIRLPAQGTKRALVFEAQGCGKMDARHLAIAEAGGADFLLTVDKVFARVCTERNLSKVKVMNPFDFVNGGNLK